MSFSCFGPILIFLSMLVDLWVNHHKSGLVCIKTSIRQPLFLDHLEHKLKQCRTAFNSHCLSKTHSLLVDRADYMGVFPPAIFSKLKMIIENMVTWNCNIGFPFLHTYSQDGTTVSIDFYHSYSLSTTIVVIRLLAGLTTFGT